MSYHIISTWDPAREVASEDVTVEAVLSIKENWDWGCFMTLNEADGLAFQCIHFLKAKIVQQTGKHRSVFEDAKGLNVKSSDIDVWVRDLSGAYKSNVVDFSMRVLPKLGVSIQESRRGCDGR